MNTVCLTRLEVFQVAHQKAVSFVFAVQEHATMWVLADGERTQVVFEFVPAIQHYCTGVLS